MTFAKFPEALLGICLAAVLAAIAPNEFFMGSCLLTAIGIAVIYTVNALNGDQESEHDDVE